jgi:transcriptional regulator with XRE-family HTH domain
LKLKEWLAESGTSYRELAGVAGINISTIHRFVAGKMWPQRDTLISLIKASGGRVTADDLLDVPKTLRAKR